MLHNEEIWKTDFRLRLHPMMDNTAKQLYREVLRQLLASPADEGCGKDTRMIFHDLGRRKCQALGVHNVDQLDQYLEECTKLFEVEINGRNAVSVTPKTTLTICHAHSNKAGSCPDRTCLDLHFCIFFLLSGECRFGGDHCLFGHELRTPHNQQLLERHLLWGLNITDLRTLFCLPGVRQGVTLPQVCRYYNKIKGCSKGGECRSLHLCLHYILGQCKFGKHCERNHEINHPQVISVLTLYGVKVKGRKLKDILHEVRLYNRKCEEELRAENEVPTHRPIQGVGAIPRFGSVPNLVQEQQYSVAPGLGASQRAPSVGRRSRTTSDSSYTTLAGSPLSSVEEICLHFLKGLCRYKENCRLLHSAETFLWRLTSFNTSADLEGESVWRDLPPYSSWRLEKVYSQPEETACTVADQNGDKLDVNFRQMMAQNKMTGQECRVRRISTPSSMSLSMKRSMFNPHSNSHLATVWTWYWKNQQGDWSQFGNEQTGRLRMMSSVVEENYQMNADTSMKFGHYVLDFSKMRLKDMETGVKFKVRRRPQFMPRNRWDEPCSVDSRSDSEISDEERGTCDEDDSDGEAEEARAVADMSDSNRHLGATAVDFAAPAGSVDHFLSPMHPSSQTYMSIKRQFTGTLGVSSTVLSIHRVDNPQLESRYRKMKSSMTKKSCKERVREERLYYGPSPDEDVTTIYTSGTNCKNPGLTFNEMDLGKGGYFHVNASRANKSIQGDEERCMFVMKCLVPRHLLMAPSAGTKPDCYVDDVSCPKTYIICKPSRVCPIYMITYQLF